MNWVDLGAMALLGLAGTLHCAGMCGGLVLCVSASGRPAPRQAAWQGGRGLAYALLGAGLGVVGMGVRTSWDNGGGRLVYLAAGLVMVAVGMGFLGVLPRFEPLARVTAPLQTGLARLLKKGTTGAAFLLGLLTGLLPCGLLYAAFARAAASAGPGEGALLMLAFWLGTSPALLGVAFAGPLMARVNPRWWPRVAGIVTILLGCMTVLKFFTAAKHGGCPNCCGE